MSERISVFFPRPPRDQQTCSSNPFWMHALKMCPRKDAEGATLAAVEGQASSRPTPGERRVESHSYVISDRSIWAPTFQSGIGLTCARSQSLKQLHSSCQLTHACTRERAALKKAAAEGKKKDKSAKTLAHSTHGSRRLFSLETQGWMQKLEHRYPDKPSNINDAWTADLRFRSPSREVALKDDNIPPRSRVADVAVVE